MFELSKDELLFLKSLNDHQVRFMIVGLTSAILQNAHVVTQDIDLWIDGLNPPMLGPASLKIFDLIAHMHGLENFETEYAKSITTTLSGLKIQILPLDRIIASKEAANREKDKVSLPALKATLAMKGI